jgi:hypothetical protein
MSETPKDKRAAALDKIRALSSRRSSAKAHGPEAKNASGGGPQTRSPKHGGGAHRPQGG